MTIDAQPASPHPAPVTDAEVVEAAVAASSPHLLDGKHRHEYGVPICCVIAGYEAARARYQERIVELETELQAERKVHHSYVRWAPCIPAAQEVRDGKA